MRGRSIFTASSARIAVAGLLTAWLACAALAQTRTWTGSGSTLTWSDAGNWSGGVVPTGAGGETIDFPASAGFHSSVQNLSSPLPIGNISFEGIGYTISGSPLKLNGASITQSVAGADAIATDLILGHELTIGGSGNLNVSGKITTDPGLTTAGVVYNGTATLKLSGSASQFDHLKLSTGAVVLDGGSLKLTQSSVVKTLDVGTATMTIQNGAVLDTSASLFSVLAGTAAVPANVTVTGSGSKWLRGPLYIGLAGNGNLDLEAGASSTSSSALFIGFGGTGSLTVQGGSTFTSGISQVGIQNNSVVTVGGAGSSWTNDGDMTLGLDGIAVYNINGGGAVVVTGTMQFTKAAVSVTGSTLTSGLLTGSGGSIAISNPAAGMALRINGATGSDSFGGAITGSGSLLKTGGSTQTLTGNNTFSGGTTITGGTLVIGAAGALPNASAVSNTAKFAVNANSNAGAVSGTGTTNIAAAAKLSASSFSQGTLSLELGGATPGTYARLADSGNLSLTNLVVTLKSGFTPAGLNAFDILDWGTLGGTFSTVTLPTLPSSLVWNTSQLYTTGVISVTSTLTGDYNGNGVVDAADYVVWRNNRGTTNAIPNDPMGGMIGTGQYNQWRSRFGQAAGSGASVGPAAVPEPEVAALGVLALVGGWMGFCRNSRAGNESFPGSNFAGVGRRGRRR